MSKHPLVIMPYLFEDEIRTIVSKLNNTFIDILNNNIDDSNVQFILKEISKSKSLLFTFANGIFCKVKLLLAIGNEFCGLEVFELLGGTPFLFVFVFLVFLLFVFVFSFFLLLLWLTVSMLL